MSKYIDEIEKISYYKERIMQEMSSMGVYPDTIAVNERIEDFDARLALFRHRYISSGDTFNAGQFNDDFKLIAEDLKIIYKLVYQLAIKEFKELKEYAEGHVAELEAMSKKYEYKTKFEIDSTSLGNTAFFQAGGFDITMDNTTAHIDLGSIDVSSGAKLACIFDADNIDPKDVVFSFDGHNCSPYSLNRDFLTVPGEIQKQTYEYTVPEDETINASHIMNIPEFKPSAKNKYVIYAGCDQIATDFDYYDKLEGTPIELADAGRITFYVLNGSFINFDFNKEPLSQNFTGTSVTNLSKHQKITMEYSSGFAFDFTTDGTVYATRGEGVVREGKLYYPNGDQVRDFHVEEYLMANKTTFEDVTVTVSGLKTDEPLVINTVAVKELNSIEGIDL